MMADQSIVPHTSAHQSGCDMNSKKKHFTSILTAYVGH